VRIQLIHRLRAGVDQVAACVPKDGKKCLVANRGIDCAKRIPNCPIQSRIALIEEPARCRRRFSDEQHSHVGWPIAPSKCFSLAVNVQSRTRSAPSCVAGQGTEHRSPTSPQHRNASVSSMRTRCRPAPSTLTCSCSAANPGQSVGESFEKPISPKRSGGRGRVTSKESSLPFSIPHFQAPSLRYLRLTCILNPMPSNRISQQQPLRGWLRSCKIKK
jgi:hypothetical protein